MLQLLRNPLVVTIIGSLIVGVFLSTAGLQIIGDQPQLGSTDNSFEVWRANTYLGTVIGHTELSEVDYATSWKPDAGDVRSEAVVMVQTTITWDNTDGWQGGWFGAFSVRIPEYHYEWYLDDTLIETGPNHVGFFDWTENDDDTITVSLATDQLGYLYGSHTGILSCRLSCDVYSYIIDPVIAPLGTGGTSEDILMAWFDAKLQSGEGYVRIGGNMPDVIEEGSEVDFRLKTGYTHAQGWTCYIISPSGERIEFLEDGFSGQDGFDGDVDFRIPIGWFIPGGDNECEIQLFNHLWQESVSTFFVIDDILLGPGKPTMSWDTDYLPGGTVQVTVSSTPNPTAQSPISYFRVYAYYGEPGSMPGFDFPSEYMIMGENYPATGGAALFSFTTVSNRDGQVTIKVNAIDEGGRASLGAFLSGDFGGDDPGPVDPDPEYPFLFSTLAIILIAVAIVGAIILFFVVPIPELWRMIVSIAWALVFIAMAIIEGTGGLF